jgi:HicA toxin of bacterial toxin-antitoxin,
VSSSLSERVEPICLERGACSESVTDTEVVQAERASENCDERPVLRMADQVEWCVMGASWVAQGRCVAKWDNVLRRLMGGQADRNIRFDDLRGLLERLGFDERVRGDHHIFTRGGVREIIDLQPLPDGNSKPYQVKQVRGILRTYGLTALP